MLGLDCYGRFTYVSPANRLPLPCYLVPGAGVEPACLAAADFKSATSTGFVTRASGLSYREPRDPDALKMGAA